MFGLQASIAAESVTCGLRLSLLGEDEGQAKLGSRVVFAGCGAPSARLADELAGSWLAELGKEPDDLAEIEITKVCAKAEARGVEDNDRGIELRFQLAEPHAEFLDVCSEDRFTGRPDRLWVGDTVKPLVPTERSTEDCIVGSRKLSSEEERVESEYDVEGGDFEDKNVEGKNVEDEDVDDEDFEDEYLEDEDVEGDDVEGDDVEDEDFDDEDFDDEDFDDEDFDDEDFDNEDLMTRTLMMRTLTMRTLKARTLKARTLKTRILKTRMPKTRMLKTRMLKMRMLKVRRLKTRMLTMERQQSSEIDLTI